MDILPVLLSGKQGSGKSTTTELLAKLLYSAGYSVMPRKFAGPLYEMHDAVLRILQRYNVSTPSKDGRLLQLLGTEWGRGNYGDDLWVRMALEAYHKENQHRAPLRGKAVFLVDDLRFQNEFNAFDFGLRFRLECPRDVRKLRCPAWRDTEDHISETDLDGYVDSVKFDRIIYTEHVSAEFAAEAIFKDIQHRLA